jgi:hypothetical protein
MEVGSYLYQLRRDMMIIQPAFNKTVVKFGVGSCFASSCGMEYTEFLSNTELRHRIENEGLRLFTERNGFDKWDDVEDGKYVRAILMKSIANELLEER